MTRHERRRRVTITDIAAAAGVSKGSVSYALNDRPGLSDATRKRILSVADNLGWRPNVAARALSGQRVGACGLVVNRPARTLALEPFFMGLISGIEAGLSARRVALMLQMADSVEEEITIYGQWSAERRVDGVLVVDLQADDPRAPALETLGLPAVVIGEPGHAGHLPVVWNDEGEAMAEVVRYLLASGHRRVGHVAGPERFVHTRLRHEAFEAVLAAAGAEGRSVATDYSGDEGARATRSLLTEVAPPTALIYDNDVMAVAGMAVAHELGLAVPDDVSIVAWDDSSLCQLVHPPLTALSRDIPAHGRAAAELLLALVDGGPVADLQVPTARLTPRGSTAARPKRPRKVTPARPVRR